ncbi:MAG: hypothetical protein ACXADW_16915 [Candidatus Hodarchaeales archaeon]|jgi:hypothetical protein
MKKFVVLYRAPASAVEAMKDVSPEDMKKGMEPWMAWVKKIGDALIELGSPLGNGQVIGKSGSSPSHSDITGYSILQADNIDEAKKLLKDHPHLMWTEGCSIEVFESFPMPE